MAFGRFVKVIVSIMLLDWLCSPAHLCLVLRIFIHSLVCSTGFENGPQALTDKTFNFCFIVEIVYPCSDPFRERLRMLLLKILGYTTLC